jgi:hypothetical protein
VTAASVAWVLGTVRRAPPAPTAAFATAFFATAFFATAFFATAFFAALAARVPDVVGLCLAFATDHPLTPHDTPIRASRNDGGRQDRREAVAEIALPGGRGPHRRRQPGSVVDEHRGRRAEHRQHTTEPHGSTSASMAVNRCSTTTRCSAAPADPVGAQAPRPQPQVVRRAEQPTVPVGGRFHGLAQQRAEPAVGRPRAPLPARRAPFPRRRGAAVAAGVRGRRRGLLPGARLAQARCRGTRLTRRNRGRRPGARIFFTFSVFSRATRRKMH